MVNFRYHLVSITAVFLALAIGLVLGVAVVNSGAVDRLQAQLDSARAARAQDDQLRRDLDTWRSFGDQAAPGLVAGHLADVPVVVIGVRGMDAGDRVKDLRADLGSADANVAATLWLTSKLRLGRPDDVRALADAFDLGSTDADAVRAAVLNRLGTELATGERGRTGTATSVAAAEPTTTATSVPATGRRTALSILVQAGFVDVDDPSSGRFDPTAPLSPSTRFVVASGSGADVPDAVGAIPLVQALVAATPDATRVLAVEPGKAASGKDPEVRGVFIGPLRAAALESRVSTVNDLEDARGRMAAVLALADLGLGRIGHYGFGAGADRLVPEAG